ncbi:MAG: AAA family ATPase, partial [Dehalococcoidia bacterium]
MDEVVEEIPYPSDNLAPNEASVGSSTSLGQTPTLERQASRSFLGRQREMRDLQVALEDTLSGQGRLAMLVGEPGIGKTRTAQELAAYAQQAGAQVIWGWCYDEEGAPPYWPWVQALRSYVLAKDPEQLQSEMGFGAATIAEIISEVHAKLPGLEPPPVLDSPEQARFRLFDSITTFLKSAAHTQPLMLVLDDLHWADKPSLLLLQFLARQLRDSCLLVVGCYRDVDLSRQHPLAEALGELSRDRLFERVLLRGLSREEVGSFIEVSSSIAPPPGLVEVVHRQTEGNPLFVTEIVRLLAQEEELTPEGACQQELQGLRIPEGVREVIGRRLNRLSQGCNRTLSIASVIGREFTLGQLGLLIDDLSEDQLLEVLEEALATRVIEELPQTVGRYQFSHRLVQETLAEELSLTRRVRLHARIAEVLEGLYGADAEAHAAELAYHFVQAETVTGSAKLVRYSLLAGEQALTAFAYEEALDHFQRALTSKEAQEVDAETAALLSGLARAQSATGGRAQVLQALDNLSQSFEYYVGVGDVDRAVAVAAVPVLGSIGVYTGQSDLVSRALALVPPDSHQAGRLFSTYGLTRYKETGDYEGAQDAFHRALAIAQREQDAALEMRTLAGASEAAWYHLRLTEVVEYGRRAVELTSQIDDPESEVRARTQMSRALTTMGDSEEARLNNASLFTTAQRLRVQTGLNDSHMRHAEFCFLRGEWLEARDYAERGLERLLESLPLHNVRAMVEYQTGAFV